jgi:hypothetical protein
VQNAVPNNPATLQVDREGGRLIYPKDVHAALRLQLGIADYPLVEQFKLDTEVEFEFFNPSKHTTQLYS